MRAAAASSFVALSDEITCLSLIRSIRERPHSSRISSGFQLRSHTVKVITVHSCSVNRLQPTHRITECGKRRSALNFTVHSVKPEWAAPSHLTVT